MDTVKSYASNFANNLNASVSKLSSKDWVRLVMVVGAYLLMRPYLLRLAARQQEKSLERDLDPVEAKAVEKAQREGVTAQDIRQNLDDSGSDGNAATTNTPLGKKARQRQRKVARKVVEEEQQKVKELEDWSDEETKTWLKEGGMGKIR